VFLVVQIALQNTLTKKTIVHCRSPLFTRVVVKLSLRNYAFSYNRVHLYAPPRDVGQIFGARKWLSMIPRPGQAVLCEMLEMYF
jgi:hypothetical protein